MESRYATVYSGLEVTLLQDADDTITKCGLWEWMREFNPATGEGFMFTNHPNLDNIIAGMKYQGHSGASFAWTMRTMQKIARVGWDEYVRLAATESPPCPCRRAKGYFAGWCGVAGGGVPACDH